MRNRSELPKRNGEGYNDPTPYEAMRKKKSNKCREYDDGLTDLDRALIIAKAVFKRYGFEVVGRIVLRKVETGEVLR